MVAGWAKGAMASSLGFEVGSTTEDHQHPLQAKAWLESPRSGSSVKHLDLPRRARIQGTIVPHTGSTVSEQLSQAVNARSEVDAGLVSATIGIPGSFQNQSGERVTRFA